MKNSIRFIVILFSISLLVACNGYKKIIKDPNYEAKEKLAKELYDKKKYARALPLYEELITVYRGTRKAEELYYYYAYCNFGVGDYLLANYWFEYFVNTYPFSSKAEECEYMAAYCFYKDSPREPLEQTNTINAIHELQAFIDAHPQSEKVKECNVLIDKLRKKLENKDYRVSVQYLNMEYYTASIVAFQNMLKDYPETDRRPEIAYNIVKAAYLYAENSVKSKRKERLMTAKDHYDKYCSKLSENKFTKDSRNLYDKINRDLSIIAKEDSVNKIIESQLFANSLQQYQTKNYKLALPGFQHILKEYPKSEHKLEASYYLIEGSYSFALSFPDNKKKKKLVDAKNNYTKFAPNISGTQYEKEVNEILMNIEKELARLDQK